MVCKDCYKFVLEDSASLKSVKSSEKYKVKSNNNYNLQFYLQ